MRRRDFISLVGSAAVMPLPGLWRANAQGSPPEAPNLPLGAHPPPAPRSTLDSAPSPEPEVPLPPERVRRVGVLMSADRRDREAQARLDALTDGLKAKGWAEGSNLKIEVRWAGDDERRIRDGAADLAELAPELMIATDRETAKALLSAGSGMPLVFLNVVDPVGAGLVAALERPGGDVTGFCQTEFGASTQWPEILKRIAPNLMSVAIIHDPDTPPNRNQIAAIQTVAPAIGLEAFGVDAKSFRELERAVAGFSRTPNGGLIVGMAAPSRRERSAIVQLAARFKLPAIYADRQFVTAGGLISYGLDLKEQYRLAAGYADRILKGEKPADLPVQTPAKFSAAINLKTAKALGLTVSPGLRELAGEVVD
jgi:putative ABC transport system substrate-binding protein